MKQDIKERLRSEISRTMADPGLCRHITLRTMVDAADRIESLERIESAARALIAASLLTWDTGVEFEALREIVEGKA